MSASLPPRPAYGVQRVSLDEITTFFYLKNSTALHAAPDPKRTLCCFRAVVLLSLASCVFLGLLLVFGSVSLQLKVASKKIWNSFTQPWRFRHH